MRPQKADLGEVLLLYWSMKSRLGRIQYVFPTSLGMPGEGTLEASILLLVLGFTENRDRSENESRSWCVKSFIYRRL